jgi:plasmid stabilization system protein ParE
MPRAEEALKLQLRQPESSEDQRSAIRRRPFGRFLIFYRVDQGAIEVIHILHGARDYESLLFPEE